MNSNMEYRQYLTHNADNIIKYNQVAANSNFLPNKLNFCCGNYSREETIRGIMVT